MFTRPRPAGCFLLLLLSCAAAFAQAERRPAPAPQPAHVPITVAATGARVRFTAVGAVERMRLEVFNAGDASVFDTGFKPGNVRDWGLTGAHGERLADGLYLCVVTVRELSGRLSFKQGTVMVEGGQASLALDEGVQPGPVEPEKALAQRSGGAEPTAMTVVAHDGANGQVTSTTGPLTFRTGDLFEGQDVERMRVTEDGRVGIGTKNPQATLDVAGAIRARGGIRFADGTVLTSAAAQKGKTGAEVPEATVSGIGTTGRLVKWKNGPAGELDDAAFFETAGNIGLGTTTPTSKLHVVGAVEIGAASGTGVNPTFRKASTAAGFSSLQLYPATGPAISPSFSIIPRSTGQANNRAQLSLYNTDFIASAVNFEVASWRARGADFIFATGKGGTGVNRPLMFAAGYLTDNVTNNGQLYLAINGNVGMGTTAPAAKLDVVGNVKATNVSATNITATNVSVTSVSATGSVSGATASVTGNLTVDTNTLFVNAATNRVGVGTLTPTAKLDVAGDINASTQYNLGGLRVLSGAGSFNLFVGVDAGVSNTTGSFNAFFGRTAGQKNTSGSNNAFFGAGAGQQTTTGGSNSFFGSGAGLLNTTGQNNSFFGTSAGDSNVSGSENSFFGSGAGDSNTSGTENSFFGRRAGQKNTNGLANSFFGAGAGQQTTTGDNNAFFGAQAGELNTSGDSNSFFGKDAGRANTTGSANSYFGAFAGAANTSGLNNAFFGSFAGNVNTSGASNSFFGAAAGDSNTTGGNNSFFGAAAGQTNTSGVGNSFFGSSAGQANTSGGSNSFFGLNAGYANSTAQNNSFFGAGAGDSTSTGSGNSFFGQGTGGANMTGFDNAFFGRETGASNNTGNNNAFFGVLAGQFNTSGGDNSFFGLGAGFQNQTGMGNSFIGNNAGTNNTTGHYNTLIGAGANVATGALSNATAIGANALVSQSNSLVLGGINEDSVNVGIGTPTPQDRLHVNGIIRVDILGSGGLAANALCLNASAQISNCSSSLRYKTALQSFTGGLNIVRRLRPLTFSWREGGTRDVGFGAEEVAEVEPLLATRNSRGQIEGVKYAQLTTVLVNAVQQQQAQIERQQNQLQEQQRQIEGLQKLICSQQPDAVVCRQGK